MTQQRFKWTVVGAGPAGIAAVGKLIDHNISPTDILWLDPHFKVGDLGHLWSNVSSNTKVQLFLKFLNAVRAFDYQNAPVDFALNHLPCEQTCMLTHIAEPLQWITNQLKKRVNSEQISITNATLAKRFWTLQSPTTCHQTDNVILATGATPSTLDYSNIPVLSFEDAIDKDRLQTKIHLSGTYGVVGSSHSAIMIIKNLVELGVKQIINFYRSPCSYALEINNGILFDNTGLKGQTAVWAREHIDGQWPDNLLRYTNTESNLMKHLPQCDKLIYAVGFQPRNTIALGDYVHSKYNPHTGIIGPGLFGLGIAYPEIKADLGGSMDAQIGLWKFMTYLTKIMPLWLRYHP